MAHDISELYIEECSNIGLLNSFLCHEKKNESKNQNTCSLVSALPVNLPVWKTDLMFVGLYFLIS